MSLRIPSLARLFANPRARGERGREPAPITALLAGSDELFAFLLGEAPHPDLCLPPGGVAARPVLEMLREMMKPVRAVHPVADWLVLEGPEVVGLISLKRPADADGVVEIGYGIADSRQRRGHASRAVALVLNELASDSRIRTVTADTAVDNIASQRVLEKNGFVRIGARTDPDDGDLICWRLPK